MFRLSLGCLMLVLGGCGQAHHNWRDAVIEPAEAEFATALQSEAGNASVTEPPTIPERKIIYEAAVTIVVEDFSKMEAGVSDLVKSHGGYMSEVEIDRTHGQYLSGRWIVRVPVDQYDDFLDSLSALGIPEKFNQTAQDVTEEYVDLEARIANKKRLEERILELLAKSEGAIKDVIEVERELARVRSEMEQMQGRLRYLQNRTALTTVTIRAIERHDYVPPQAPSFLGRVGLAWANSLVALRRFGEGIAVGVVFLFPWLVLLAILLVPAAWCVRRLRKRANAEPPARDDPA